MNTQTNNIKSSNEVMDATTGHLKYMAIFFVVIYLLILSPDTSFARTGDNRAKFNFSPFAKIINRTKEGVTPLAVTYDGSRSRDKDGSIVSYHWDFGDGATGSGATINHTFSKAGNYTITLLVTDNQGATSADNTEIRVISPQSNADIGSRPVGIYSTGKAVDLPFVSGVARRFGWSELEPEEGVYDFSGIEEVINEAQLIGQSVTITTLLFKEPQWLMQKVPDQDKYRGIQSTDIVPWNVTMLNALEKLSRAQSNFKVNGIRIKDHPAVKQVSASVGTMNSIRMRTIPNDYTPELIKSSITRSIRFWAQAYPNKHIFVGLFDLNDGTNKNRNSPIRSTAEELRDDLMAEFNGIDKQRLNFFIEFMTGKTPLITNDRLFDAKDITSILMQACGAWTEQDGRWKKCDWLEPIDTPEQGIKNAMENFNTTYFEIYYSDLVNPAYYNQLVEAGFKIQELADSLDK